MSAVVIDLRYVSKEKLVIGIKKAVRNYLLDEKDVHKADAINHLWELKNFPEQEDITLHTCWDIKLVWKAKGAAWIYREVGTKVVTTKFKTLASALEHYKNERKTPPL
jgi:hypothetical protein